MGQGMVLILSPTTHVVRKMSKERQPRIDEAPDSLFGQGALRLAEYARPSMHGPSHSCGCSRSTLAGNSRIQCAPAAQSLHRSGSIRTPITVQPMPQRALREWIDRRPCYRLSGGRELKAASAAIPRSRRCCVSPPWSPCVPKKVLCPTDATREIVTDLLCTGNTWRMAAKCRI